MYDDHCDYRCFSSPLFSLLVYSKHDLRKPFLLFLLPHYSQLHLCLHFILHFLFYLFCIPLFLLLLNFVNLFAEISSTGNNYFRSSTSLLTLEVIADCLVHICDILKIAYTATRYILPFANMCYSLSVSSQFAAILVGCYVIHLVVLLDGHRIMADGNNNKVTGSTSPPPPTAVTVTAPAPQCPSPIDLRVDTNWLEKVVFGNFRIWHILFSAIAAGIALTVVLCCLFRCRIPRTKQEIEADFIRKKITDSFRSHLEKIKIDELQSHQANLLPVLKKVELFEEDRVLKNEGFEKRKLTWKQKLKRFFTIGKASDDDITDRSVDKLKDQENDGSKKMTEEEMKIVEKEVEGAKTDSLALNMINDQIAIFGYFGESKKDKQKRLKEQKKAAKALKKEQKIKQKLEKKLAKQEAQGHKKASKSSISSARTKSTQKLLELRGDTLNADHQQQQWLSSTSEDSGQPTADETDTKKIGDDAIDNKMITIDIEDTDAVVARDIPIFAEQQSEMPTNKDDASENDDRGYHEISLPIPDKEVLERRSTKKPSSSFASRFSFRDTVQKFMTRSFGAKPKQKEELVINIEMVSSKTDEDDENAESAISPKVESLPQPPPAPPTSSSSQLGIVTIPKIKCSPPPPPLPEHDHHIIIDDQIDDDQLRKRSKKKKWAELSRKELFSLRSAKVGESITSVDPNLLHIPPISAKVGKEKKTDLHDVIKSKMAESKSSTKKVESQKISKADVKLAIPEEKVEKKRLKDKVKEITKQREKEKKEIQSKETISKEIKSKESKPIIKKETEVVPKSIKTKDDSNVMEKVKKDKKDKTDKKQQREIEKGKTSESIDRSEEDIKNVPQLQPEKHRTTAKKIPKEKDQKQSTEVKKLATKTDAKIKIISATKSEIEEDQSKIKKSKERKRQKEKLPVKFDTEKKTKIDKVKQMKDPDDQSESIISHDDRDTSKHASKDIRDDRKMDTFPVIEEKPKERKQRLKKVELNLTPIAGPSKTIGEEHISKKSKEKADRQSHQQDTTVDDDKLKRKEKTKRFETMLATLDGELKGKLQKREQKEQKGKTIKRSKTIENDRRQSLETIEKEEDERLLNRAKDEFKKRLSDVLLQRQSLLRQETSTSAAQSKITETAKAPMMASSSTTEIEHRPLSKRIHIRKQQTSSSEIEIPVEHIYTQDNKTDDNSQREGELAATTGETKAGSEIVTIGRPTTIPYVSSSPTISIVTDNLVKKVVRESPDTGENRELTYERSRDVIISVQPSRSSSPTHVTPVTVPVMIEPDKSKTQRPTQPPPPPPPTPSTSSSKTETTTSQIRQRKKDKTKKESKK